MADTNFAVRLDIFTSGDDTRRFIAPYVGKDLGGNEPQFRRG